MTFLVGAVSLSVAGAATAFILFTKKNNIFLVFVIPFTEAKETSEGQTFKMQHLGMKKKKVL